MFIRLKMLAIFILAQDLLIIVIFRVVCEDSRSHTADDVQPG